MSANFITHTEALEMLCPFYAVAKRNNEETCAGEDCMMWRHWGSTAEYGKGIQDIGYCGLAGRPE
jgi:predicted ArsR family transcriptional regulator